MTFWDELLRTLATPDGLGGAAADRRLHSLTGAAASLGYAAVAAAARRRRAMPGTDDDGLVAESELFAALQSALAADIDNLPAELSKRVMAVLADQPAPAGTMEGGEHLHAGAPRGHA